MNRFVSGARRGRLGLFSAGVAVCLLAGCTEKAGSPMDAGPEEEQEAPLPGLVVSEARGVPPGPASSSAAAAYGAPVAYVSAAPGTLPEAIQVRARNETTGAAPLPPVIVVSGGFDPVAVPANPQDRIEIAVMQHGGVVAYVHLTVPKRRPPVVVRTNPPKGRTDVAISIRPRVVFSEPIDPASLEPGSILLIRDGSAVDGVLAVVADQPFAVEFTPAAPLEPLTHYELIVTTAVRDHDGEPVPEEQAIGFSTESNQGPPAVEATYPEANAKDVPVSVQPDIVFTRRIDPESLSPTSVQLFRDGDLGSPVAGVVAIHPTNPFVVKFVPDAMLESLTTYTMVVSTAIRSLDGAALEESFVTEFHTEFTGTGGAMARVSTVTTGGAFDVDSYRVRVTAGGQLLRSAVLDLNASIDVGPLPAGEVTIELVDVAANCAVTGEASRNVDLPAFSVVTVEFRTTCTPPPELGAVRLMFSRWDRFNTAGTVVHLWSMNADGTDRRQLTNGTVTDFGALPSPDGSRVAFSRNTEGHGPWGLFGTWVMDADGSGVTQLTGHQNLAWSWSPDGAKLALQGGRGIEVVQADGSGRRVIFQYPDNGFPSSPAWSPDGSMIAFLRYFRPAGAEGFECGNPALRNEIWLMDADGGNPRFLRRLLTCWQGSHLSWTKDGEILFTDAPDGQWPTLWRMRSDGTGVAAHITLPTGMDLGGWTSDGKLVTMTGTPPGDPTEWRVDVFLLNVETGDLVRVTADGVSMGAAVLR